ncbi:MAG TPA: 2-oxoacid:ferredoxin oxidoreductase subunit beta, partial [Bacteroidales bacterium]|nr:2-oxoacid:ferredoxin oxidoreductase subunit beta [Bacteroidales bacterium]
ILVHDQYETEPGIHMMIARMMPPEYPVALGVIRSVAFETFDQKMVDTIETEKQKATIKSVDDLLNSGGTWTIE